MEKRVSVPRIHFRVNKQELAYKNWGNCPVSPSKPCSASSYNILLFLGWRSLSLSLSLHIWGQQNPVPVTWLLTSDRSPRAAWLRDPASSSSLRARAAGRGVQGLGGLASWLPAWNRPGGSEVRLSACCLASGMGTGAWEPERHVRVKALSSQRVY